ncbi:hypothetical protein ACFO1B_39255 [Dactylosporangium siamense]|uniref:Uncharacterized protein n=1 Tax=Dactylosporangium siamense TaxID=685454 RepID=A0A919PXE9_9ACTN|nr:hypothetical protein [Dactylosporangium siamense]GIG50283.1 hypothetical protein Dsi01nite_083240 [Dactylosporangium siamense]
MQLRVWVAGATAAFTALFGIGTGIGAFAGHDQFAGFPHAAWPGAAVLLLATAAVLTHRRWAAWTLAVVLLAGSCWLLLNLVELALTGTVTDRHGDPAWLAFLERLGLTTAGALLVATTVRRRTAGLRPLAHSAPARIRRIAYAGCAAWLPYGGVHLLGAFGVPGLEPEGFRPSPSMAIALCVGLSLAVFLLLGLVHPWGMVFPRWTILLAGRRVPRFLPIVPVWLIAPTFVLYGLGAGVYVMLLIGGVLHWHGRTGLDAAGYIGVAQPISFAGYGLALTVCAVSYQLRTRPTPVTLPPKLEAESPEPSSRTAL